MFKEDDARLAVDVEDDRLAAVFIDSFAAGLGVERQSDTVIFRLWHKDWPQPAGLILRHRLHQFALPARQAAELGRLLMAMAAQAEKETGKTEH